jgi:serine/threonine protein kinase
LTESSSREFNEWKINRKSNPIPFRQIRPIEELQIPQFIHPCIKTSIEPENPQQMISLKQILSNPPDWWTSTNKAVVVAGILLGLMALHNRGIVHRNLKPSNILFDTKHRPQLTNYGLLPGSQKFHLYSAPELKRDEEAGPACDAFSVSVILYEILVPHARGGGKLQLQIVTQKLTGVDFRKVPKELPEFVRQLIEKGWSAEPIARQSIQDMFEEIRNNDFKVLNDVESEDVFDFVNWVEIRGSESWDESELQERRGESQ